MKALISGLMLVLAQACTSTTGRTDACSAQTLAFVGVSVVPMDAERVLEHQTVVVRDGIIADIGPMTTTSVPEDARRIDGRGMFVLPGLTDAHVHLRDPSELLSYLAHGVTTVVHLSGPTGNVSSVLELRDRVERGELLGPTIYTSGRILDGAPPIYASVSTVVETPEEAKRAVDAQCAGGVDLVKVYNNLGAEELRAVTRSAHAHGVTVWGHVPRIDGRSTALQRALDAGLDVIAHGEEVFFTFLYRDVEAQLDRGMVPTVGRDRIDEAVRLIREHGVAVIPNLSFVAMTRAQLDDAKAVWADPEARYLHPAVLETWRQQNPTTRADLPRFDLRERGKRIVLRELTRELAAAGVPLMLGTDASAPGMFPGASAWLELSELVGAGLTPFGALRTGTCTAGAFLRRVDPRGPASGTVTAGARADLVLLHADPLASIPRADRIAGVVVRGRWFTRDELEARRAKAVRAR
jgi:imidazolonepropionase-like amidohydrolase